MRRKRVLALVAALSLPSVRAHCPLCTVGAAAAVGGATLLGIPPAGIAVFVGAFGVSTGLMVARKLRPRWRNLVALLSFVLTVWPLSALLAMPKPLYIDLGGEYGSLLHATYVVDVSLVAALIGGAIVFAAPFLSRSVTRWRQGSMIPYQGIVLSFALLITASALAGILV